MLQRVSLAILCLWVLGPSALLSGESLSDFLKRLPSDSDPGFVAANVRDLSGYQTPSKWQPPLGSGPAFTFIAAVEAAYTRKYCEDPSSSFYKAGYCERYQAYKAAALPDFYLASSDHWNAFNDSKALDLSELYFIDRVKTCLTTSAGSNHEAGNTFCEQDGITHPLVGPASMALSQIRLPEEKDSDYIFDPTFYHDVQKAVFHSDGCTDCDSPSQEELDAYEFWGRRLDVKDSNDAWVHRAFIPFEGRRNARFGVSDMLIGNAGALPDPVKFLEKCIYRNFEVAVVGATSGHAMLLIGYDRNRKMFLYKDHYHRFQEVDYETTKSNISDFQVILEPYGNWSNPSREEMWIGQWDVWTDGNFGSLVLRRTRLAANVRFSDSDLNKDFPTLSTFSWARVGTYYQGSTRRVVYGRLNGSLGDTMDMIIDFDHPEPPPPSTEITGTPTGQLFQLRMFKSGEGAAAYATGTTTANNVPVGVLMKRPEENPYGLIPREPVGSFDRGKWIGSFNVRFDISQGGVLKLHSTDGLQTLAGTYQANGSDFVSTLSGQFVEHHQVRLIGTTSTSILYSLDLYFHRNDDRLVTGKYNLGGSSYAVFGSRVSGEKGFFHSRVFFPYYDVAAGTFNGIGITNYSSVLTSLKFTAYARTGGEADVPKNPAGVIVLSGDQLAKQATEIFGGNPGSITTPCWIELSADTAEIGTLAQFGDGQNHIDGAVAWSAVAKEMYISRIYQGPTAFRGKPAETILAIANPTGATADVRFDLIGPGGETLDFSQLYHIEPHAVLQRSVANFFIGSIPDISAGYMRVRVASGEGVVVAAVVRLSQPRTSFGLNALVPSSSLALFSAQVAKVPGLFTEVRLINTSNVTRTATIRGISGAGLVVGAVRTVKLSAGQVYTNYLGNIIDLEGNTQLVGSLKVEADGPGIVGDVVFGESDNSSYVAALALQDRPFNKAIFSQVANGMGYFTGLAVFNPADEAADVKIKIYNKTGLLTGETTEALPAGHRFSKLLPELVAASDSQIGGYVILESNQPVVAQQMFGGLNLNFLSAVPPATIR